MPGPARRSSAAVPEPVARDADVRARAALLAPALVQELPHCGLAARRVGVKVLGFAGAGYEAAVADAGGTRRRTVRPRGAPRARPDGHRRTRLRSSRSSSQNGNARSRAAAEEALWHFPPARVARRFVRELLGNREFVLQNPATVTHVLDRAAKAGIDGLDPVLAELEPLRFRFWNLGLVRVALKAREHARAMTAHTTATAVAAALPGRPVRCRC